MPHCDWSKYCHACLSVLLYSGGENNLDIYSDNTVITHLVQCDSPVQLVAQKLKLQWKRIDG